MAVFWLLSWQGWTFKVCHRIATSPLFTWKCHSSRHRHWLWQTCVTVCHSAHCAGLVQFLEGSKVNEVKPVLRGEFSTWIIQLFFVVHTYLSRIAQQSRSCALHIPLTLRKVVWTKAPRWNTGVTPLQVIANCSTWLIVISLNPAEPTCSASLQDENSTSVSLGGHGHLGKPNPGKSIDFRPLASVLLLPRKTLT